MSEKSSGIGKVSRRKSKGKKWLEGFITDNQILKKHVPKRGKIPKENLPKVKNRNDIRNPRSHNIRLGRGRHQLNHVGSHDPGGSAEKFSQLRKPMEKSGGNCVLLTESSDKLRKKPGDSYSSTKKGGGGGEKNHGMKWGWGGRGAMRGKTERS